MQKVFSAYGKHSIVRNKIRGSVIGEFHYKLNRRIPNSTNPKEFTEEIPQYQIINQLRASGNRPIFLIGVTISDESDQYILRTIDSIFETSAQLYEDTNLTAMKIIVIFIFDGVEQIEKTMQKFLKDLFIDESTKAKFARDLRRMKRGVKAASFDVLTIQTLLKKNIKTNQDLHTNKIIHLFSLFVIKYIQEGVKLGSHFWLINGYAEYLNPRYILLLEAGMRLQRNTLSQFYSLLEYDPDIFSAAAHINVKYKSLIDEIFLPLGLDFKLTNFIDSQSESLIRYKSAKAGTFYCFRMDRLKYTKIKLLYFRDSKSGAFSFASTETDNNQNKTDNFNSLWKSNLLLTEERIIPHLLYMLESRLTETGSKDIAIQRYCYDIEAEIDGPINVIAWLSDIKRYVNGTLAGFLFTVKDSFRLFINDSNHGIIYKILFAIHVLINMIEGIITFLMMGLHYFTLSILTKATFDSSNYAKLLSFNYIILLAYIAMIGVVLIFSMIFTVDSIQLVRVSSTNVENQKYKSAITLTRILITLLAALLCFAHLFIDIFMIIFLITKYSGNSTEKSFATQLVILYALYILLHLLPVTLTSKKKKDIVLILIYLALKPAYIIISHIYSICNIDDINIKALNLITQSGAKLRMFKQIYLFLWLGCNIILGYFLSVSNERPGVDNSDFLVYLFGFIDFVLAFKITGGILYNLYYRILRKKAASVLKKEREKNMNIYFDEKNFSKPPEGVLIGEY